MILQIWLCQLLPISFIHRARLEELLPQCEVKSLLPGEGKGWDFRGLRWPEPFWVALPPPLWFWAFVLSFWGQ